MLLAFLLALRMRRPCLAAACTYSRMCSHPCGCAPTHPPKPPHPPKPDPRAQAASKWRSSTPEAKAASDRAAWSSWLARYCRRLAREAAAGAGARERAAAMSGANPRVVLRNWVAEEAIRSAEAGDYGAVRALLAVLTQPYKEASELGGAALAAAGAKGAGGAAAAAAAEPAGAPEPAAGVGPLRIGGKPPAWAGELCVTCSS